jgi:hypothetical protein
VVILFILLSDFSVGLTRFANLHSVNIDTKKFLNLEDIYSIRILVLSIVFTSVATFFHYVSTWFGHKAKTRTAVIDNIDLLFVCTTYDPISTSPEWFMR